MNYGKTSSNGNEVYKVAFDPTFPYLWTPMFIEIGHYGVNRAKFSKDPDPSFLVIKIRESYTFSSSPLKLVN